MAAQLKGVLIREQTSQFPGQTVGVGKCAEVAPSREQSPKRSVVASVGSDEHVLRILRACAEERKQTRNC